MEANDQAYLDALKANALCGKNGGVTINMNLKAEMEKPEFKQKVMDFEAWKPTDFEQVADADGTCKYDQLMQHHENGIKKWEEFAGPGTMSMTPEYIGGFFDCLMMKHPDGATYA